MLRIAWIFLACWGDVADNEFEIAKAAFVCVWAKNRIGGRLVKKGLEVRPLGAGSTTRPGWLCYEGIFMEGPKKRFGGVARKSRIGRKCGSGCAEVMVISVCLGGGVGADFMG